MILWSNKQHFFNWKPILLIYKINVLEKQNKSNKLSAQYIYWKKKEKLLANVLIIVLVTKNIQ